MKNLIRIICAAALAAAAICGCQRELVSPERVENHSVCFTAFGAQTRTAVVEGESLASFVWTAADASRFHIWENGVEADEYIADFSSDMKTATLLATFPGAAPASCTYKAVLAQYMSEGNPVIPSEQIVTGESYDDDADVLVSDDLEASGRIDDELLFCFNRVGSVVKMTLSGFENGEIVEKAVIRADKAITGTYDLGTAAFTAGSQVLTVDCDLMAEDGEVSVCFISVPVEAATLSIKVTTDKAVYSKTFGRTISFPHGKMTRFAVDLEGCEEGSNPTESYRLVTEAPADWSGEYVLASGYRDEVKLMTGKGSGDYAGVSPEVLVTDGEILLADVPEDAKITVASSTNGYTLFVDDTFVGYTSTATSKYNNLWFSSSAEAQKYEWTIDIDDDGSALVCNVFNEARTILFNSDRFAGYVTAMAPVWLFRRASGSTLAKRDRGLAFSNYQENCKVGDSFTVTVSGETAGLGFSSSDAAVATIDATTGVVSALKVGSTVITASAAEDENFKAGSISFTLNVATNATPGTDPHASDTGWYLVKDAAYLQAGDVIRIGCAARGVAAGYMGEGKNMPAVSATFDGEKMTAPANAAVITLSGSASAWTLSTPEGDIYAYTAKTLTYKSDASVKTWPISIDQVTGAATIGVQTSSAGRFLFNTSSSFFSTYTSDASSSMLLPEIYKKYGDEPVGKMDQTLSFTPSSVSLTLGDEFTAPTLAGAYSTGARAWSSSNTSVATVDASTGAVSIVSYGTAVISVSVAGDDNYNPASASYTISVAQPVSQIVWELVTDASQLVAGRECVITALGSDYALGAFGTKNFTGVAVTKGEGTVTINDKVLILTLCTGFSSGTWAFQTNGKYISPKGAKNESMLSTTLNAAASWTVTLSNGEAVLESTGEATYKYFQKNTSSALFSCYNGSQSGVSLYVKQ